MLVSCEKGNDSDVSGKVLNKITNEGIEGIRVVVFENEQGLLSQSATGSVIAEDVSDANGSYLIEFDSKSRAKFSYSLESYFETDKYGSYISIVDNLGKKSANQQNLYLFPLGILTVYANPAPPYNSGDTFSGTIKHTQGHDEFIVEDDYVKSDGYLFSLKAIMGMWA
ncbi:MAG: hypothetical protein COA57_16300 [Flavobacteriales bacterium]|nr:MAG: hypothetical protein COA57_16300 [Flavobacteriales bacterium]